MKDHAWRGVFKPLKDLKVFKAFRVDREWSTIEWPTGAEPGARSSTSGQRPEGPGRGAGHVKRPTAPTTTPSLLHLSILCTELPGIRLSCYEPVHLGIQRGKEVIDSVPADRKQATFDASFRVGRQRDGSPNFLGPYAQGPVGDRFVYLSWGVNRSAAASRCSGASSSASAISAGSRSGVDGQRQADPCDAAAHRRARRPALRHAAGHARLLEDRLIAGSAGLGGRAPRHAVTGRGADLRISRHEPPLAVPRMRVGHGSRLRHERVRSRVPERAADDRAPRPRRAGLRRAGRQVGRARDPAARLLRLATVLRALVAPPAATPARLRAEPAWPRRLRSSRERLPDARLRGGRREPSEAKDLESAVSWGHSDGQHPRDPRRARLPRADGAESCSSAPSIRTARNPVIIELWEDGRVAARRSGRSRLRARVPGEHAGGSPCRREFFSSWSWAREPEAAGARMAASLPGFPRGRLHRGRLAQVAGAHAHAVG